MQNSAAAAAAKSLQSCLTLCGPIEAAHQAPPSLGFSRQEHWSGFKTQLLPWITNKLRVHRKGLSSCGSIHYLPQWRSGGPSHPCWGNKCIFSLRADIPAGRMRQFLQTLYLCGLACSSYGLPRCGIRSLQSQKRKRGKKLSAVDLNACKNSSWDLFPARPTGASTRWVRWDRWSDA